LLKEYRESLDLIIVIIVTIVFASFGISVYFIDSIHNLFSRYIGLPLESVVVKLCFFYLTGLLWVTFYRWKKAEHKKKELEEVVSSISSDVLIVVGPKDEIVLCNQPVMKVFGYAVDEVVGKRVDFLCSDILPYKENENPDRTEFQGEVFNKALVNGKTKDGRDIPLEAIYTGLKSGNRRVMLLRDIAEQKKLEEELNAISAEVPGLLSISRNAGEVKDLYNNLSRIMSELTHYVSIPTIELAEKIATGEKAGAGEIVQVTVLFSDIRGFTSFSENMDPAEVFKMLNIYLSVQIKIVEKYGGIIDKLTGDEVMAVFTGPRMAVRALECGREIINALSDPSFETGGEWIAVGIGINTGAAYMGSVGSDTRKDHTVVGTTVNIAARLCGFAKKFQVIFPESTKSLVDGAALDCRSVGKISLKGLSTPVEVFELV
jgi:PAS domain S-box-containing protein